jgi:hypothetical protein
MKPPSTNFLTGVGRVVSPSIPMIEPSFTSAIPTEATWLAAS